MEPNTPNQRNRNTNTNTSTREWNEKAKRLPSTSCEQHRYRLHRTIFFPSTPGNSSRVHHHQSQPTRYPSRVARRTRHGIQRDPRHNKRAQQPGIGHNRPRAHQISGRLARGRSYPTRCLSCEVPMRNADADENPDKTGSDRKVAMAPTPNSRITTCHRPTQRVNAMVTFTCRRTTRASSLRSPVTVHRGYDEKTNRQSGRSPEGKTCHFPPPPPPPPQRIASRSLLSPEPRPWAGTRAAMIIAAKGIERMTRTNELMEAPTAFHNCLANPQPRERARYNQRGNKTLLNLTPVRRYEVTCKVKNRREVSGRR